MTAGIEEATGTPRPIPGEPDVAERVEQRDERRSDTVAGTRFAHASEAEMARILDFYAVRWEYEPMTFPILWNTDGDVIESFSPDFYLPEYDLYIELTTMRQALVRRKNRKLRLLRALYPEINIKLLYTLVFSLGAALAGFAGVMQAPILTVQIGMGENILILAFVVIIIGGIGSIRGAFVAAVIVGLIDTIGRSFLPDVLRLALSNNAAQTLGPSLSSMSIYMLMAAILVFRPEGLFPAASQ